MFPTVSSQSLLFPIENKNLNVNENTTLPPVSHRCEAWSVTLTSHIAGISEQISEKNIST
jgi:hypothetical protein